MFKLFKLCVEFIQRDVRFGKLRIYRTYLENVVDPLEVSMVL